MTDTAPHSLYWWSQDGLRLHALRYAGPAAAAARPTILALPGLTRNARDFAGVAAHLADRFNIIAVDFRGRGDSAWAKDPLTYVPLTYVRDIEQLILDQKLERMIFIGTSLGGIVTMLMAGLLGDTVCGAVLNDIGPDLDPVGVQRIRGYVGKVGSFASWMHCAHGVQAANKHVYPHYDMEDWLLMAKSVACLEPSGRIVFDYDPKIAEPFKLPGGEAGVNLWPLFDMLAQRPVLSVRGATSDILSAATLADMHTRGAATVTVPGIGHAPTLTEPDARTVLDAFLQQFL
jgi:pimeloyl-ACP methyl ester carboxylesterase